MKIEVKGANAHITERTLLTSGAVGLTCEFAFDKAWDGLMKTAVFRAGSVTRDVVDIQTVTTVPHEVLEQAGQRLQIGVYGTNKSGDLAIPTVWADGGLILNGADPSGDPGTAPTLPVWAQVKTDTVQTVPQTLTEKQQKQARENIGAATQADMESTARITEENTAAIESLQAAASYKKLYDTVTVTEADVAAAGEEGVTCITVGSKDVDLSQYSEIMLRIYVPAGSSTLNSSRYSYMQINMTATSDFEVNTLSYTNSSAANAFANTAKDWFSVTTHWRNKKFLSGSIAHNSPNNISTPQTALGWSAVPDTVNLDLHYFHITAQYQTVAFKFPAGSYVEVYAR